MVIINPMVTFVFLVLLGLLCVVIVIRACTLPRGAKRGPACGRCGYAYSGWARCPECGGEAAEFGVETPRLLMKRRGGGVTAFVVIVLLSVVAAAVVRSGAEFACRRAGWRFNISQSIHSPRGANAVRFGVLFYHSIRPSVNGDPRWNERIVLIQPGKPFGYVTPTRPRTKGLIHAVIESGGAYTVLDKSGLIIDRGERFGVDGARRLVDIASLGLDDPTSDFVASQISEEVVGPDGTFDLTYVLNAADSGY